jgi:hypothetical protein
MNRIKLILPKLIFSLLASTIVSVVGCSSSQKSTPTQVSQAPSPEPSTPTLPSTVYRVGYRVCNVLDRRGERGCQEQSLEEQRSPAGMVLMWSDDGIQPEDMHIEIIDRQTGGVRTYLFIRSKGCINTRPAAEDFYYTGLSYSLDGSIRATVDSVPQPEWSITATEIDPQQATMFIESLLTAEGYFQSGETGRCLPLAPWMERYGKR